jgi:hypothetical protein
MKSQSCLFELLFQTGRVGKHILEPYLTIFLEDMPHRIKINSHIALFRVNKNLCRKISTCSMVLTTLSISFFISYSAIALSRCRLMAARLIFTIGLSTKDLKRFVRSFSLRKESEIKRKGIFFADFYSIL